jgi:hypothetical protein
MTFMLACVVMLCLTVTTFALLAIATTEPRIANNLLLGSQAFYIAESGLEIALWELNAGKLPDYASRKIGGGSVTITVQGTILERLLDPVHVRVLARGQVGTAVRVVSNTFVRDANGHWSPMARFREEASP